MRPLFGKILICIIAVSLIVLTMYGPGQALFSQGGPKKDNLLYANLNLSDAQKHAFFREMVEMDVNLRSAVSNAVVGDSLRAASAFWLMSRFVTPQNPRFRESITVVFNKLKQLGLYRNIEAIQAQALANYKYLQAATKNQTPVDWKKIDSSLVEISQACRSCHMSMIPK